MRSKAGIFESSILKQEKALAPFVAIAPQLRTAEPTANPHEIGLFGLLGSCVFAGASYATWRLCWRLLFEKTPKKPRVVGMFGWYQPWYQWRLLWRQS